jgi:hypothetical protein
MKRVEDLYKRQVYQSLSTEWYNWKKKEDRGYDGTVITYDSPNFGGVQYQINSRFNISVYIDGTFAFDIWTLNPFGKLARLKRALKDKTRRKEKAERTMFLASAIKKAGVSK